MELKSPAPSTLRPAADDHDSEDFKMSSSCEEDENFSDTVEAVVTRDSESEAAQALTKGDVSKESAIDESDGDSNEEDLSDKEDSDANKDNQRSKRARRTVAIVDRGKKNKVMNFRAFANGLHILKKQTSPSSTQSTRKGQRMRIRSSVTAIRALMKKVHAT